jgi:hypothetical protein
MSPSRKLACWLDTLLSRIRSLTVSNPLVPQHESSVSVPFSRDEVTSALSERVANFTSTGSVNIWATEFEQQGNVPTIFMTTRGRQFERKLSLVKVALDMDRPIAAPPAPVNPVVEVLLISRKDHFHRGLLHTSNRYVMSIIMARGFIRILFNDFFETGDKFNSRAILLKLPNTGVCDGKNLLSFYDSRDKCKAAISNWAKERNLDGLLNVRNESDKSSWLEKPEKKRSGKTVLAGIITGSLRDLFYYMITCLTDIGMPDDRVQAWNNAPRDNISVANLFGDSDADIAKINGSLFQSGTPPVTVLTEAMAQVTTTGVVTEFFVKAVLRERVTWCQKRMRCIEADLAEPKDEQAVAKRQKESDDYAVLVYGRDSQRPSLKHTEEEKK